MVERTQIERGMKLLGRDGRRLGKIVSTGPDGLQAARGILVRRRFQVGWDEVEGLSPEGEVKVARNRRGALPLQPKDLGEAKIDRARYQSERLPPAPEGWDGTATSPLERMRMDEPTGLGVKTHEEIAPPTGPLSTTPPEDPHAGR